VLQWAAAATILLLMVAAIAVPNLLRPRMASSESSLLARSRNVALQEAQETSKRPLFAGAPAHDKKLIRSAELAFVVSDVRATADQLRRLTESNNGEIDKAEVIESGSGYLSATLVLRLPASGLETSLAQFRKLAVRVDREQVAVRDVTSEFYDNAAHLRNLQAEEQQYLAIMKQARTIRDTLDVSEKLSDARDRIERLSEQVQIMTHDIDMSAVTIALMQESDTRVFSLQWRPLYNAKVAASELLTGLGEWADWVMAVLIKLPLIVLWLATASGILWAFWLIGRRIWLRFVRSDPRT
jgi:hypothetical protein